MATDRQEAVRSVAGDHEPGAGVISAVEVLDVRFPTSSKLDGSDAMNPSPDYSAAYIRLRSGDRETGYSLVFTVGLPEELERVQAARDAGGRDVRLGLGADKAWRAAEAVAFGPAIDPPEVTLSEVGSGRMGRRSPPASNGRPVGDSPR